MCLNREILTHVEEIRRKWSRSDHESDLKVTICLICLQFAIFYLLNKARIEIRLIRSKSRIFELTSDDFKYDLNRLVWSRRVQRCIIHASTTLGTYSSTFGIVQPIFLNWKISNNVFIWKNQFNFLSSMLLLMRI
jgi:hypothetical protein